MSSIPTLPPATETDQRIVVRDVPWSDYRLLSDLLSAPGLHISYYQGTLELMTISPLHERIKTVIARLVELFTLETDIQLEGYGSTTFRDEGRAAGTEPDECYVIGGQLDEFPDLAIEVVVSSGGFSKLEVYRRLGVGEVWFWRDDAIHVFRLAGDQYEPAGASALLPALDLAALGRFVLFHIRDGHSQHDTVKRYRAWLRGDGDLPPA